MNNKSLPFPVVLASASRYKKSLLERLQFPFECYAPNIDESIKENEKPKGAALRLAKEKALAVKEVYKEQNTIIIGCDQVAFIEDGKASPFLGKPENKSNAKIQLLRSSGNCVVFYTAVHVLQSGMSESYDYLDTTTVKYRLLSEMDVDYYLERENALDCAGSCKIEGLGITLLDKVKSTDPSALIGLPLIGLNKILLENF
jgi:MAF protein